MPSSVYPDPPSTALTGHLTDTADSHDASAIGFTPAGSIAATDVQAAIEEVASEAGGHNEDHDHDGAPTQKLAQANTHESPDTDVGPTSLHHTLGTGANQAAAGTDTRLAEAATHVADGSAAHAASAVAFTPNGSIAATDVQAAIQEVRDEAGAGAHPDLATHDALGLATDSELTAHTGDATDAHDASAISFTPNGSIAATDVQAAIQEVRDEATGGGVTVEDEGTPLATTATTLDFVGAGVTATGAGAEKTITIPGGALDLSGLTLERLVAGISDYVAGYDASAADERGFPVGQLLMGRSHTVVRDECWFNSITTDYEGGLIQAVSGTAAATSAASSTRTHPGVIFLSTGTTTTGRCAIWNVNATNALELGTGGKIRMGIVAKLENLSDATNTYFVHMGLMDGVAAEPQDGIYFRYNHAQNSGEWQGVARQNDTEGTPVDTNVAADTNWHTFEFEINAAGTSVEFFIDGVSVGTASSNLPSGTGQYVRLAPASIRKTAGATARVLSLDAYWLIMEFTTPR